MTGPNLRLSETPPEGLIPKAYWFFKNTPSDFKTVIEWVIKNFKPAADPAAPGANGITVTDGTTTLHGITVISFDGAWFTVSSGGDGVANITLQTESCP